MANDLTSALTLNLQLPGCSPRAGCCWLLLSIILIQLYNIQIINQRGYSGSTIDTQI